MGGRRILSGHGNSMKRSIERTFLRVAGLTAPALISGAAFADRPQPWQLGLQDPVTPVADKLQDLHTLLLWIITLTVIFVLGLLGYVCVRFRAKANPTPSTTSHNTIIEVLWTMIPVLILLVIAVPSFKLLYFQETVPKSDLTLKVTGLQWYWHYAYPDSGDFGFDSVLVDDKDLKDPTLRLLDVDNEVVLPIDTNVRIQIAGSDVMHSWFVPALAVQKYAVVGRLNEVWVNIEKEGTYFGECNQICGVNHAYMPIKVHAVSKEAFAKWVEQAKGKFAREDGTPPATRLASDEPSARH
jgi:cytochrome c oxidase subunit II